MGLMDFSSARRGKLSEAISKLKVSPKTTDTNNYTPQFSKWFGYYVEIPEVQAVIQRFVEWVIYGEELEADELGNLNIREMKFGSEADKKRAMNIVGNGKQTFRGVLENCLITKKIAGDSIAEIVTRNKKGLINVKPNDPELFTIQGNEKGWITGYEEMATGKIWKPESIFHLMNKQVANEIHGRSTIEKLEEIIILRKLAMTDTSDIIHRFVMPFLIFEADSDDDAELEIQRTNISKSISERDFMLVPKGTLNLMKEMMLSPQSLTDSLAWIKYLERAFLIVEGVPEIVSGIGRETTDATSRIILHGWNKIVVAEQIRTEEQVKAQLKIVVHLPRPREVLLPKTEIKKIEQKMGELATKKTNEKPKS